MAAGVTGEIGADVPSPAETVGYRVAPEHATVQSHSTGVTTAWVMTTTNRAVQNLQTVPVSLYHSWLTRLEVQP